MGFLKTGLIEKNINFLFILFLVNKVKKFNNKTNVIVYTVLLGLGFATIVLVGIFISIQILRTMNKQDKVTEKRALEHQTPSTPTPSKPRLKELARQGNPRAIAALLNRSLQPKGITVKVALDQRCLQVMLISAQVPAIELVKVIRDGLKRLGIESIEQVKIYGKQVGEDIPDWHQEFEFVPPSLATETFAEPVNPPTRTPRRKLTPVKLSAIVALVAISLVGISYFASQITEIFAANNSPRTSSYQSSPSLEPSPQYQAELSAAEQAIQANPNNHQAWYNKAQALSNLKRYPEALAAYDKAWQINSNYIQAWSGRSLILRWLNHFDEALIAANKALQINPNFAEGWKDKCGALWELKRHQEALTACDKAVQLQPDFPPAWHNRGLVLASLKRYEDAFTSFDKAVQLRPDYFGALFDRGRVLGTLQRFEEAVALFDKAIELEPNNQYAWAYRGEALAAMQQYREAMDSYAKATQIDPTYRDAWNAAIILERKWREYKNAVASGDLVLQTKLRQSDSWCYRAAFVSDTQDILVSYDKALQINPNNIDAWNGRGSILQGLGQYEEAIAAYDRAIQVNPKFGWAWYNRGLVLEQLGRYEEALDSYDKAIQSGSFPAVEEARKDLRRRLGKSNKDIA
jgi:tetratricopeptide (TPR) repeat protein